MLGHRQCPRDGIGKYAPQVSLCLRVHHLRQCSCTSRCFCCLSSLSLSTDCSCLRLSFSRSRTSCGAGVFSIPPGSASCCASPVLYHNARTVGSAQVVIVCQDHYLCVISFTEGSFSMKKLQHPRDLRENMRKQLLVGLFMSPCRVYFNSLLHPQYESL